MGPAAAAAAPKEVQYSPPGGDLHEDFLQDNTQDGRLRLSATWLMHARALPEVQAPPVRAGPHCRKEPSEGSLRVAVQPPPAPIAPPPPTPTTAADAALVALQARLAAAIWAEHVSHEAGRCSPGGCEA